MRHFHKLKHLHKKIRPHHAISGFAVVGIAIAALNFTHAPLFSSLDRFVLFASDNIQLAHDVQVSSGDLGSNTTIDIQKDAIVNGNLYADKIALAKNVQINGTIASNKLTKGASSTIFGSTSSSVSLPIANLPQVPNFSVGTQDFTFTGATSTLPAGSYRTITIAPSSTLTLSGGTYRLRALDLQDNATLIFNAPTTLNIQFKFKGKDHIVVLPGPNLKPDDLKINYLGIRSTNDKATEDDDNEIASLLDGQEKKDLKAGKIGRPIVFGKDSFLNFNLLAPKANVNLKENTTLRGQVLARRIGVGKGAIVSREEFFSKDADVSKIIEDRGTRLIANEVVLLISENATISDVEQIIDRVNGRIIGFLDVLRMVKVEIPTNSITQLNDAVDTIRALNSPFILNVGVNFIFN